MRTIAFIQDLFIILHLLSHCSLDRGFNTILWHIHRLCILKTTAKGRIGVRIRSTCFHCNSNFFPDTGELFRHPVPAGKHGGFSNFKNSSHDKKSLVSKSLSQIGLQIYSNDCKRKTSRSSFSMPLMSCLIWHRSDDESGTTVSWYTIETLNRVPIECTPG